MALLAFTANDSRLCGSRCPSHALSCRISALQVAVDERGKKQVSFSVYVVVHRLNDGTKLYAVDKTFISV